MEIKYKGKVLNYVKDDNGEVWFKVRDIMNCLEEKVTLATYTFTIYVPKEYTKYGLMPCSNGARKRSLLTNYEGIKRYVPYLTKPSVHFTIFLHESLKRL